MHLSILFVSTYLHLLHRWQEELLAYLAAPVHHICVFLSRPTPTLAGGAALLANVGARVEHILVYIYLTIYALSGYDLSAYLCICMYVCRGCGDWRWLSICVYMYIGAAGTGAG